MAIKDENNKLDTTPLSLVVEEESDRMRLDKWLSTQLPEITRTRLKALIEDGQVTRNGTPATSASGKIHTGETYIITIPPVEDAIPEPEDIPLNILYEDDDLIVLVKPAGLVVHPGSGNWSGTLVNALLHHCKDSLSGIGGVARPGIVHRLDKDTSGVMVVAKNDQTHQGLSAQFADHTIERAYLALVIGAPRPGYGKINKPLSRSASDRKKIAIARQDNQNARHAITHYKVQASYGAARGSLPGEALASLVKCRLETGRTHQIRVHMAAINHPLIGDQIYGRGPGLAGLKPGDAAADKAIATSREFRRQALHAAILGFTHPKTGEALRFEYAPPDDFKALQSALEAL